MSTLVAPHPSARRGFVLGVLGLLFSVGFGATASAQNLSVTQYILVGERTVSRAISEYEYRAVVTNPTPTPYGQVRADLAALGSTTTVVDGVLTFSDVPANGTRASTDTFMVRRQRNRTLEPTQLVWTFSVNGNFAVGDYRLIRERRITSQVSEFDYEATLTNRGATGIDGASASVVSALETTTVVEGGLLFGSVAAGQSRRSTDTFTLRRRRSVPLVPASLGWTIIPESSTGNRPPVAVITPLQAPVFVGSSVTLDGSSSTDPDGNPLSYSWTLSNRPAGSQATLSGTTSTVPFTPDVTGNYSVQLTVNDGSLSNSTTLTFSTVNRPPTALIAPLGEAFVTQPVTLDGSGSTDPDGDVLTYSWTVVSHPAGSTATPATSNGAITSFAPDRPGAYELSLVVSDGTLSDDAIIGFSTSNSPPVAHAGSAQSVAVGTTVTLDGSGSTDVDGDALTFEWRIASRPASSASQLSDPSVVMPTFNVDVAGTYTFELVVRDPSNAASPPSVVSVSTVNSPPVANAGVDQTVAGGALVQLNGTGSTDVDGDPLSYLWELVQVPPGSTATLAAATSASPTFVADRRGLFVVRLTVFDLSGAMTSDEVNITTNNSAPVANAGLDQSVALTAIVQLDGSGSTDVDGDTLGYSWSFTSRPNGSVATLTDSDTPSPTFVVDIAGAYVVQLIVADGQGGSDIDTVTISTANTRPVANAGLDQAVSVGQTVTLNGLASTDADGDALTYSWALTTTPTGSAATLSGADSAQPTFVADVPGEFVAQLIVSDGTLTSEPDTVTISTGNTTPVANAGPDQENVPLGESVELSGDASTDADGNPLTYVWALLSRPPGSMAELDSLTGVSTSFTPDVGGDFVVQLVVNDGFTDSAPDTATVHANHPPIANAGADRNVALGAPVTLSGLASTDADFDLLAFSWTLAGPLGSAASLDNPVSSTPTFVPDVVGVFTATLVVNDGLNSSASDQVLLTAEATAGLGLAPATQTVRTFTTTPVTVTVTPPAGPGDLEVALSSDSPAIATVPTSVTISAGQSVAMFDATTGSTPGTATITASAPSVTSASATVSVTLRSLGLSLEAATVGVNRTILGSVLLAEPAPVGGATIAVVSDAPGMATVSPAAVVIPEGDSSGGFSVFGAGLGSANVLATATGFAGASSPVTSTITLTLTPTPFEIERAENRTATLSLSAPAPQGGLTIFLSSDNPNLATVPTSIAVAAGQSSADVIVTGVLEGTTTVRATRGGLIAAALEVTVVPPSPARIESSPANGEGAVAVTRETILRFSRAIDNPELITPQTLFAQFGGQTLQSRIHVAPDRKTVTLFYLQTLPASARIRVQFQTNGLIDELGVAFDGDHNGEPGGVAVVDFDTLTLTTLTGTAVVGRVFASELGDGGVNTPLVGVVISVDGLETTLRTTTDAMGNFRLDPAPVGEFFVHIDGRAATNDVPVGAYYPIVGKKWESRAGQATTIPDVFLPLIVAGTLQPVSQTEDTVVTFPASVLAQHPELAGVRLTVPADSLYSDSGARGGMVGIAPVAPDRIPSPLPQGLTLPLVITVQTDGATNFDRPVPVCFPNLPNPTTAQPLAAGAKSALWSFNHDIGDWEIAGPMTVSQDGILICSDPGIGVRQPGWHGTQPGTQLDGSFGEFTCPSSEFSASSVLASDTPSCRTTNTGKIFKGFAAFWDLARQALKWLLDAAESLLPQAKVNFAVKFLRGADAAADLAECLETSTACQGQQTAFGTIHNDDVSPSLSSIDRFKQSWTQLIDQLETDPDIPLTMFSDDFRRILEIEKKAADGVFPKADRARKLGVDLSTDSEPQSLALAVTSQSTLAATGLTDAERRLAALEYLSILSDLSREVPELLDRHHQLLIAFQAEAQRFATPSSTLVGRTFVLLEIGSVVMRSQSEMATLRSIVSPDTLIRVRTYRPNSGAVGYWSNVSASAGVSTTTGLIPESFLEESDLDQDGLGDSAEEILGTRADSPDSDSDEVSDWAEVQQGTDPLDGIVVQTGILTTVDTLGPAIDIFARNDLAVVATNESGISVLNVAAGANPVVIVQVDTPGVAHAVAFEGTLVAVADGPAGLAIVDISDPPAARVVQQLGPSILGGDATAVVVAGGTVYVGLSTNQIVAVDLFTGTVLEFVTLGGVGPIEDVAIERDTLYALTVGTLYAIPLQSPLQVGGSITSPGFRGAGNRRLRLFAGGGIVYATHTAGYNTFSLADPAHPALIAGGSTPQLGWKQIVANGSGLGFAAVGPNSTDDGPHNVSLYDTSDPTQTDRFITEFETPGLAAAVSIYNGIGYVADSEAGLQVVNYLAFDRNGIAPTIALDSNYALSPDAGVAEEGHVMRLTANVDDDVQVRNVEFFVNGVSVARDGNFPFEHRFVTPLLGASTSFTVRACAADTGGNRTCTGEIAVTLVEDATPPNVRVVTPPDGSSHPQNTIASLSATFSETIDVATLTSSTFQLFSAGPDTQVGTLDDVSVPGGTISYNAQSATAVMAFASPLPVGNYGAVVAAAVADLSGNPMATGVSWSFSVRGEKRWIGDASGLWSEAANWSDNEVPQDGDFVTIDRPGVDLTITYDVGALLLMTIRSEEHVVIAAGPLSIEQTAAWNGGLTLTGTLAGPAPMTASTFSLSGGRLEGSGDFVVLGTTTLLAGTLSARTLRLGPTTSSDVVHEEVRFESNANVINPAGSTWTVTSVSEFALGFFATSGSVTNLGTIVKLGIGLLRVGAGFNNSGLVDVRAGNMLMSGGGSSSGTFLGQAGTILEWGAHLLEASSVVNTPGVVQIGGPVSSNGLFTARELTVQGGSSQMTFSGAVPAIDTLNVNFAVARFSTVSPVAIGTVNLQGAPTGIRTSTNLGIGTLNWTSGGFEFDAPATVSVSGATTFTNVAGFGATIFGDGGVVQLGTQTVFANGAQLVMGGGTLLRNPSGGAMQLTGQLAITWNSGASSNPTSVVNDGSITKQGDETATFGSLIGLDNDGTIDLQSGTLGLHGGVIGNGTLTGASSSTLSFNGASVLGADSQVETLGTVQFAGQTTVGGFFSAGSVVVGGETTFSGTVGSLGSALTITANGAVGFDGDVPFDIPPLTMTGGQLRGTALVRSPSFDWQGGSLRGTGTLEIAGATTIRNTEPFGMGMSARTLRLGTLTSWQNASTFFVESGSTILNSAGATLRFEADAVVDGGFGGLSSIVNQGVLEFSGPARHVSISAATFLNQGTLVHRLGGTSADQYDRMTFGSDVTLGGTLDIRTMNGFIPASGDSFTLSTYPSRSGEFTTVQGNGETYTVTYGATALTVEKP